MKVQKLKFNLEKEIITGENGWLKRTHTQHLRITVIVNTHEDQMKKSALKNNKVIFLFIPSQTLRLIWDWLEKEKQKGS